MAKKLNQMSNDDLFQSWSQAIRMIYNEAVDQAWNRQMFEKLSEIFEANRQLQHKGAHVWEWFRRNYVAGAAMSLRREIDKQAGTTNLRHILHEISKRPDVISRRRYEDSWALQNPPGTAQEQLEKESRKRSFDRFQPKRNPNDADLDHIDPASVLSDLAELDSETEKVRSFIEQTFAHRAPIKPASVTFEEFNAAVDAVQKLIRKYYALLTQTWVSHMAPVPVFDIDAPFRFPWL